ncbi:uncharacterized protein LOC114938557 [Nylanderia fulva]|uniref:uncharacterized protein LOC114938557 n=1 Tax=Nylanderia fulva TaxID=613905 RepID=UPI0010FBA14F|nr:uncharacterized protein LOC114938557 [Nylanderia fulva]
MMNNPLLSDFWLKKGLTTLLATYTVNKAYPDYRILNLFVVQNQHYSFNLDGNHMWPSTSQDDSLLKIRQSIRAPFILRMMQHILTEEMFQESISTYAYDTESHDEGFVELTKHIALKNPNITQQLTKMEDWALENHCPVIKAVRNYHDREIMSEVNVSIQNIDTLKLAAFL